MRLDDLDLLQAHPREAGARRVDKGLAGQPPRVHGQFGAEAQRARLARPRARELLAEVAEEDLRAPLKRARAVTVAGVEEAHAAAGRLRERGAQLAVLARVVAPQELVALASRAAKREKDRGGSGGGAGPRQK